MTEEEEELRLFFLPPSRAQTSTEITTKSTVGAATKYENVCTAVSPSPGIAPGSWLIRGAAKAMSESCFIMCAVYAVAAVTPNGSR